MGKKLTFATIPQFPRANYEVDIPWSYLEDWLGRQLRECGLDLDPDFQRAHVWTKDQQRAYIEYCLKGGEVGRQLIFNCTNWDNFSRPGVFVLVDGKQRMEAVRAFLRDEVEIFGGHKCSELGKLSQEDRVATVAKKVAVITESELATVQALRARREQLGRELGQVQAQLTAREDDLVARVQEGVRVRGNLTAVLDTKVVCNPSYKDELVAHFEQAHGISAALVEEEVRKRWRRDKIVLVIGAKLKAVK